MPGEEYSLAELRVVADYQWGSGAGSALFPQDNEIQISRSRSGRPRQVLSTEGRLVSFTTYGLFTLGIEGGKRLQAGLEPSAYQVCVGSESEGFVRDGKNAFAKFVVAVDPVIRPDDEVLVVSSDGELLGVGRAELSASAMVDFDRGMAVYVRAGIG